MFGLVSVLRTLGSRFLGDVGGSRSKGVFNPFAVCVTLTRRGQAARLVFSAVCVHDVHLIVEGPNVFLRSCVGAPEKYRRYDQTQFMKGHPI